MNAGPDGVLTADEIAILIRAAGAAPSMHNTQPWRFDVVDSVAGAVVDVLLDVDRVLPAEDPSGRLVRIGLGAATFNLRVAAAMLGHAATVVTDPDPARADIVARLFLGPRGAGGELGALYGEVHRRHTYRGPMTHLPVDDRLRTVLHQAARSEGAALVWLDAGQVQQLLGLVVEAEVLDHADEARRTEFARWIGGDRRYDGVPSDALGPQPDEFPLAYRDLGSGVDAGVDGEQRELASFETEQQIAVLVTPADGPAAWLRAGMALQRVLLLASEHAVSASFVNQPLEHPEQRHYVRTIVGSGQPQQIIRLGYPSGPGVRTPRRPWRELRQQ